MGAGQGGDSWQGRHATQRAPVALAALESDLCIFFLTHLAVNEYTYLHDDG